ncbi:hypothetical protein JM654_01900 [Microbacterium oxydans]|nr:hypothetical protein [Microbacterium oxydans]
MTPTPAEGPAGGSWELYDLELDPTETVDVAHAHPEVVAALADRWHAEAWRNTVFPLDDEGALFRVRPDTEEPLSAPVDLIPFRPPLERFRAAKLTVLRSFRIEVDLEAGHDAAGVIVAHGDQGGGYLLALDRGAPLLVYNAYGRMHRARGSLLGAGPHRLVVRMDEQPGLRWSASVEVDGRDDARIDDVSMLIGMSPFTGISVGYDFGGPVDWELHEEHRSYPFRGGSLQRVRYVPGARSVHDATVLRAVGRAVLTVAD